MLAIVQGGANSCKHLLADLGLADGVHGGLVRLGTDRE